MSTIRESVIHVAATWIATGISYWVIWKFVIQYCFGMYGANGLALLVILMAAGLSAQKVKAK